MYDLAEKIIELRLATRRACMCEGVEGAKKNTLSLKTKVLFLIDKACTPKEIISAMRIAKTNLALITKEMADEGLIEKSKGNLDRREVTYSITRKGKEYLNLRLRSVENDLTEKFVSDEQYLEAIDTVIRAITLLGE